MRTLTYVLFVLALSATPAPGADDPLPEAYALLTQRNIFSSTRTKPRPRTSEPEVKVEPADPLRNWMVRGCITGDGGLRVMLENIANPGETRLLGVGDEIDAARIAALTLDTVTLALDEDRSRSVQVGQSLAGAAALTPVIVSGRPAGSAASGQDAVSQMPSSETDQGASTDEKTESILERLRRRRQQEQGR